MKSLIRMVCLAVLLTTAGQVQAGFLTYTTQAAYLTAVSGKLQTLENFELQTIREFAGTGAINETGFNGFNLTGNQNGELVGVRTASVAGNVNSTKFLGWQNGNGSVGPVINFVLSNPSIGFAFNWRDTDPTDEYELSINGNSFFNPPFSTGTGTGFFGVVATLGDIITVATIRNAVGQTPGGVVDPFGVDDIRTASAVPEPASMAIWGIGALGMGLVARRRRAKKATTA